jgi:hypothetical protein
VQPGHVTANGRRPELVALFRDVGGDVPQPDRVERQRTERFLEPAPA